MKCKTNQGELSFFDCKVIVTTNEEWKEEILENEKYTFVEKINGNSYLFVINPINDLLVYEIDNFGNGIYSFFNQFLSDNKYTFEDFLSKLKITNLDCEDTYFYTSNLVSIYINYIVLYDTSGGYDTDVEFKFNNILN